MNNFRQRVILGVTVISVVICIIALRYDFGVDTTTKEYVQTTTEKYVEHTSTNQKSNNNLNIESTVETTSTVSPTESEGINIKDGLVKVNGVWGYYLNNELQSNYTGLQTNKNGTFIVEKGIVNFGITGLKRVKGEWYYFKKGKLQTNYTGIKSNVNGTWLVEDGEIDFKYKGTYVTSGTVSKPKKGQKRYYVTKNKVNTKRSTIVTQALAYVNTPYVYGGTNLKKGIDCSAFTRAIYKKAGISLERTARSQATRGKSVSLKKAKPGDLIFYSNGRYSSITHVAIYLGNNRIVHAGYSKKKVAVANVNIGMNIKCIKSYIN